MARLACTLAVLVLVAACGSSSTPPAGSSGPLSAAQLKGKNMYFCDYGGALTAADKKYFGDPFAQKFGVNVQFINYDDPPTTVHLQEQSGSVQCDMFAVTYNNYKQGDVEIFPSWLQADAKKYAGDLAGTFNIQSGDTADVIACNPAVVKKCPTNAAEFWDVANFPGPRAMVGVAPPDDDLLFAEMAMGTSADKLYPINIDAAINKLKAIKSSVSVWTTSGGQMQQVLTNKEVGIEFGWNGRMFTVQRDSIPNLQISWNNSTVEGKGGGIGVAKNAPDRDVAFAYIDWWLQQDSLQAQWMTVITYPAPSQSAYKLLAPNIAALMPYSNSHALPISVDPVWQYDNLTKEEQAFQTFLTS
jgi:spermidine/putrescine-binding protein